MTRSEAKSNEQRFALTKKTRKKQINKNASVPLRGVFENATQRRGVRAQRALKQRRATRLVSKSPFVIKLTVSRVCERAKRERIIFQCEETTRSEATNITARHFAPIALVASLLLNSSLRSSWLARSNNFSMFVASLLFGGTFVVKLTLQNREHCGHLGAGF